MIQRRTFLTGLLATGAAAGGLGTGAARAAPLDDVVKRGRLSVAVYRDFAPWSFRRDGKLVGVDVDIARAFAKALSVTPEINELTADESVEDDLRNGVWKGSKVGGAVSDLMMHVPFDPLFAQRITEAVLFGPYHRETYVMACNPALADCDGGIGGLETIGVEVDSIPDFYLSGALNGRFRSKARRFITPVQAVEALRGGEIPAALAPLAQIEHGLNGAMDGFQVGAMPLPGLFRPSWDVGMAVQEDSRDLAYKVGDIVMAMEEAGELQAIFARYGITHVSTVPV